MALFRYAALNETGRNIQGTIDAESVQDAKQKLIRRQILVVKVTSITAKKGGKRLKKSEILSLTRELARLLEAGLPLYESLSALEEKYQGYPTHELLLDLSDKIRAGQPFSEALRTHPNSFDVLYIAMVSNAEQSGNLAKALVELSHLIERQLQVQKQLLSAFLYPALLGVFCLFVLSVLLFFVIPSLFELFDGRSLHPFTRFVFACSRLALDGKWVLMIFLSIVASWGAWSIFSIGGRKRSREFLLSMPGFKELFAKVALTRFFRASATLIEGGLPALFAMQQAKAILGHPALERSMEEALKMLGEGESLCFALQGRRFVPPLIPRMLGIAQEGGNLPSMMHQISTIYEEEMEKVLARIASLAQPILLLVLGAMIGFVLLSVLLPLTDVSSFST